MCRAGDMTWQSWPNHQNDNTAAAQQGAFEQFSSHAREQRGFGLRLQQHVGLGGDIGPGGLGIADLRKRKGGCLSL